MFEDPAEDQFFDSNQLLETASQNSQQPRSRDHSQVPQNWLNEEEDFDQYQDQENEELQGDLNYEPGLDNFETEERETHKRNIPTPHSEPNNQDSQAPNVINAYIPSFANNSQNLNRVPFRTYQTKTEEARVFNKPHEFSIRLDAGSLGLEKNAKATFSSVADYNPTETPTYQGQDQLKQRVSELEYALRQEMLRNEETQAMNFALKQLLDEFRNQKNSARFARPST